MPGKNIAGFPGGVDNKQAMVDLKIKTAMTSPINIANGQTELIRVLLPQAARKRAIDRVYLIPDGLAVSDHATGAIIIGIASDTDALVASTGVRNILANVFTLLTKAATLVGAGAANAWAQGKPILPKDTDLIVTMTALAAGGTGRVTIGVDYWNDDETSA